LQTNNHLPRKQVPASLPNTAAKGLKYARREDELAEDAQHCPHSMRALDACRDMMQPLKTFKHVVPSIVRLDGKDGPHSTLGGTPAQDAPPRALHLDDP